jgi:hypothetical protein
MLEPCCTLQRWGFGFLLVSSRCCVSLMRPSRHSGESLLRVSLRRWRPASVLPTLGIRVFTRFFAVLRLANATFPALGGVASTRLPTALEASLLYFTTLGIRVFTRFFAVLRLANATFPALGGVASTYASPYGVGTRFWALRQVSPYGVGALGAGRAVIARPAAGPDIARISRRS